MNVDVTINVRYDKTENIAPGKTVVVTENITITDSVPEETVQKYIADMTPAVIVV